MRLRWPCEHKDDEHLEGHYEPHRDLYWVDDRQTAYRPLCPGGVFLPESDLLTEIDTQSLIDELVKRREWPYGIPPTAIAEAL